MIRLKDWFRHKPTPQSGLMSFDGTATVDALDALRREQHIANLLAIMGLHRAGEYELFEMSEAARAQLTELGVIAPIDEDDLEGLNQS